jgi:hypothetical protein
MELQVVSAKSFWRRSSQSAHVGVVLAAVNAHRESQTGLETIKRHRLADGRPRSALPTLVPVVIHSAFTSVG